MSGTTTIQIDFQSHLLRQVATAHGRRSFLAAPALISRGWHLWDFIAAVRVRPPLIRRALCAGRSVGLSVRNVFCSVLPFMHFISRRRRRRRPRLFRRRSQLLIFACTAGPPVERIRRKDRRGIDKAEEFFIKALIYHTYKASFHFHPNNLLLRPLISGSRASLPRPRQK